MYMNFGLRVQDCEGYKTPRFTVVQKAMPKLFGYAPLETWILGLFFLSGHALMLVLSLTLDTKRLTRHWRRTCSTGVCWNQP